MLPESASLPVPFDEYFLFQVLSVEEEQKFGSPRTLVVRADTEKKERIRILLFIF